VTLRFRGREMAHQEFGVRLLERIKGDLEDVAQVESMAQARGPADDHGLAPKKKK
jgi:translation initiation factor IF-3